MKSTDQKLSIVRHIAIKTPKVFRVDPTMAPILMAIGSWWMMQELFAPRFAGAAHWVSLLISACISLYSVFG